MTASPSPDRMSGHGRATVVRGDSTAALEARTREPWTPITATAPAVSPPTGKEELCTFHV